MTEPLQMTRRAYLTIKALEAQDGFIPKLGTYGVFVASEAVASTALEHPEWDMAEARTWDEWEADHD